MDDAARRTLIELVTEQRVAALGTLYKGGPLVSMVPFSATPALAAFDIHVSRLAQHTQGLLSSPRVGLMIAEPDRESRNPQTLARLSLQGESAVLEPSSREYADARASYLDRFPAAKMNFQLPDFLLVRIILQSARLVTGFGRIYDLGTADLAAAAD